MLKNPNECTKEELAALVQRLRDWLYLDLDENDAEVLNPDKEWDSGADFCEYAAEQLDSLGLVPDEEVKL